jgi:aspartate aminotransferase/aminotransferase
MVTSGVSGGILLSFLALLDPGDEILLPDPNFMMYRHLAHLCGATIKFYDLYPGFHVDPGQIDELVSERTKIVFLNSPGNPAGNVLARREVEALVRAAERVGALVVSDEIYDAYVYDVEYASPVGMTDRVLQVGGFSKTFGIAGWRLGFATGPSDLIEAMAKLQQYTFVCAPAPLQHAVLEAAFDIDIGPYLADYRDKRDLIAAELHPAYELVPPGGSFYAFPRLPGRASEPAFMEAALARRLLVVPGSVFSRRASHFRLSFAATDEVLRRGLRELNELAEQFAQ